VYDLPAVPGAAWLEMALAAAGSGPVGLRDVAFERMMLLPAGQARTVQLVLTPDGAGGAAFAVSSLPDGAAATADWPRHARGHTGPAKPLLRASAPLSDLRFRLREPLAAEPLYDRLRARGLHYGPAFRGVEQVWRRDREALGRLRLPAEQSAAFRVHPALLDAAFQLVAAALPAQTSDAMTYVPAGLAGLCFHRSPTSPGWGHVVLRLTGADAVEADVRLLDDAGQVAVEVAGLRLEAVTTRPAVADIVAPELRADGTAPTPDAVLAAAAPERHDLLQTYLRQQVADTLGLTVAKVDVAAPLPSLGLDSLMTVRLGMRLERAFRLKVEMVDFVEGLSVSALTTKLLERMTAAAPHQEG
jgi:acyl carrier protein